jgi:hypothetical protein
LLPLLRKLALLVPSRSPLRSKRLSHSRKRHSRKRHSRTQMNQSPILKPRMKIAVAVAVEVDAVGAALKKMVSKMDVKRVSTMVLSRRSLMRIQIPQ